MAQWLKNGNEYTNIVDRIDKILIEKYIDDSDDSYLIKFYFKNENRIIAIGFFKKIVAESIVENILNSDNAIYEIPECVKRIGDK